MQVQINDRTIRLMGSGRVFKDNQQRINSIDFHRTEDVLITGSDDDSIRVYNTAQGTQMDILWSKKYGCSNVCITHATSCALYATRKPPPQATDQAWYALRYHDLRRNEYLRYFKGHTGPITSLNLSPKTDLFMSGSLDKSVRLWDLRTNICQGIMHVPGVPCTSFDQQGLVFAVATESGVVKLYDVRSYDKGPFDAFTLQEEVNTPSPYSDIRFSSDGKYLLGVVESRLYVMDAFNGTVVRKFNNGLGEGGPPLEATFSPDNQYVLSGCDDRTIRVWSIATGAEVAVWPGHAGTPTCLKFAPRRLLVASACQALVLWIPPLHALDAQPVGPM
uniref:Anaphase-promoting complex subunit 4 WD40 domain-containing protein n=1 Tax=Chlamydomonas leiostraca TaxID=1034604 RepID=A0A7S0WIF9_9CHLO|mmetsp:Transcript_14723/g.36705  ORF Transcript_14723/g.36705 Transcript_14723/m.36705 type:complete len:333 (+) Transcript_14723:150-1148(+)|eukprot:CAMPEP_0202869630 /NCGR_PEP_ID=MMETSP1391-20130828/12559_1 /ASSEMBLY_ACC=CAM_ASM_000867 /TAXON_ID=1034604 /ORGANISM="Chlamydomonas leiostraca, Strain SAG 11-49" /LENGTH=332 /DNA_ID=CAMNT_0049549967 /DNA_START=146 /DNA_END=1144 /DNA_ORIENTATION=-